MKNIASLAVFALASSFGVAFAADGYDLNISPASAGANARATVKVSVAPKGAYHVNTEYPVKLSVTAPDGVTLEKALLTKDDAKRFERAGLDFEVAFVPASSGRKSFTGTLKFAVCTDTECKPAVEKVSFDVDVK